MIKKKVIAIIPARGNSSRLKNKNMKKFNGRPLIQWTIESAIKCKLINDILISTDSEKILKFCKKYKSVILSRRPKKLAKKTSKMKDVVLHEIKKNKLKNYDYFILLQPTSPLRTLETISEGIRLCYKKKLKSCVSFYRINDKFLNNFVFKKKGIKPLKKELYESKKSYCIPSGDIYISEVRNFIKSKSFLNKNTIPYFIKHEYSDIDELKEFNIAEKYHKNEKNF